MPTGRFWKATRLSLLLALMGVQQAQAALFDDEEARRQIQDLTIKTNERVDTLAKAQMELLNQIQALREENAKLRGSVETLNFELESAKKRQQDFYIDLDGRLRKLETPEAANTENATPPEEGTPGAEAASKPAGDPAAESREYEAALNLFKANKIKEAAGAFEAFTKAHPDSTLAPNAQYWLGNALYGKGEVKEAQALQYEADRIIYKMCEAHGNLYAVQKEILRRMYGLELGGVREPMPSLIPEDEAIVAEAQAMIEAAIAKL